MWSVTESEIDREDWPESPRPPWPAKVRAMLWWHRATDEALQYTVRGHHRIPITIGMLVDYLESPVGPYREVLASPQLTAPARRFLLMPRMQVPFIAVDSAESVHGGRSHWQLPKTLAHFEGDPRSTMSATTDDWSVTATARQTRLRLPIAGGLGFAQPLTAPDAALEHVRAAARLVGVCRPARIDVNTDGPTLPEWLRSGTHNGVVITRGRMVTGPGRRC